GFLARYGGEWRFSHDARTSRFPMVQGSGIPLLPGRGNQLGQVSLAGLDLTDGEITVRALEPRVRALLAENAALLLPDRGELVLDPEASQIRENGRLISLYFDWNVDGVPVEGAHVFVRINNGNVTQLGAPLVGPIDADTTPVLDGPAALSALWRYTGDEEVARLVRPAELILEPRETERGGLDYRLGWKITYRL